MIENITSRLNFEHSYNVVFAPHIDQAWIYSLAIAFGVLFIVSFFLKHRGAFLRLLAAGALILGLLNPIVTEEKRESLTDTVLVILDESQSQSIANRTQQSEEVLAHLRARINEEPGLEMRVVRTETTPSAHAGNQTNLFELIGENFSDIPSARRAGVIMITDGQVHDVPNILPEQSLYGPISAVLSGRKDERDRQIVIHKSPTYGIVGKGTEVRLSIQDTQDIKNAVSSLNVRTQGGEEKIISVPVNRPFRIELDIAHAGQNIFELSVPDAGDELTMLNNKAAIVVNGVRDRLKVLLVSGKPNSGSRTWRNLLTSDASVDLVHFTILRDPSKQDFASQNELSLIPFPFRELFEEKIYDFNLIIFDQYETQNILPDYYFNNIAKYVSEGGAFLEVSGPSYASENSVYMTSLMKILPAAPAGTLRNAAFVPGLTAKGKQHPVTQKLSWPGGEEEWGQWLRQVSLQPLRGDILMQGHEDSPLLVLDRVGEGRVAHIGSDHIWLWSRGYDGGGPHSELMKRTIHWLMKEPELDERALRIAVSGSSISLEKSNFAARDDRRYELIMTDPAGREETISMTQSKEGPFQANINAQDIGVYEFNDNGHIYHAVIGQLNPPELLDAIASEDKLGPLAQNTNGQIIWESDNAAPSLSYANKTSHFLSNLSQNSIPLRKNESYRVSDALSRPALPSWAYLLIIAGLIVLAWWHEGQSRQRKA